MITAATGGDPLTAEAPTWANGPASVDVSESVRPPLVIVPGTYNNAPAGTPLNRIRILVPELALLFAAPALTKYPVSVLAVNSEPSVLFDGPPCVLNAVGKFSPI